MAKLYIVDLTEEEREELERLVRATQLRFLEATVRERLAEVAGAQVDHLDVRVAGRRR